MKKIALLVTLTTVFLCLPAVCSAAHWYWLASNSNSSFYIDTSSAFKSGHWLRSWFKITHPDGTYVIEDVACTINRGRVRYSLGEYCTYSANGKVESYDFGFTNTTEVAPDSIGEEVFVKALYMYRDR